MRPCATLPVPQNYIICKNATGPHCPVISRCRGRGAGPFHASALERVHYRSSCRPRSSPGWFECLAVGVCLPVGQRRSAGRCVVRERGRGPPQCPANVWGRACETRVNEWRVEGRVIGARSCLKICTRSRLPCTSARRHAQLCGQDSQLVLSSSRGFLLSLCRLAVNCRDLLLVL